MKIGQYLAKIWTRVQCATFFETRCMSWLCYKHDVRLSVCPSVCNVGGLWSHSATKSGNRHITGQV